MFLFNFLLLALSISSNIAQDDQVVFVKRVDTGLPDLNEPINLSHTLLPPSSPKSSSSSIPFEPISIGSSSNAPDAAERRRQRHREAMRAKRKIVKETFENRHNLGFSDEQIKALEASNRAEKDSKNQRNRERSKAIRLRVKQGNPRQSDLNFVDSQRRSSARWHERNPEKAAKAKRSWAQRNPKSVLKSAEKRKLKRQQSKNIATTSAAISEKDQS